MAGPNARKSAVVLLEKTGSDVAFLSLYEKIGSSGSLFSDERILSILSAEASLVDVMVDCPISEPPCVACVRPTCPGVIRCDDIGVAMMTAMEQTRGRKGAHKLRPINPQNQRLWDVMFSRSDLWGNLEPSYSANLAPLVVRAKTLQRRLKSSFVDFELSETNVPILLSQLAIIFDHEDWSKLYRNFERGNKVRREVLTLLSNASDDRLRIEISQDALSDISSSVENFQAFMAAAMSIWRLRGLAMPRSAIFETQSGWVEVLKSDREGNLSKPTKPRQKLLS